VARIDRKLADNAPGPWWVDSSCIDCDLCRQIAPAVFGHDAARDRSVVVRQPASDGERRRAAMAVVACPTSSIGSDDAALVREAARAFPEPLDADGRVSFCGYASEDSYGAASYLLRRAEGNVLVDSPRAARPLLARLRELGGVATLFLTHADDVADHATFARAFACKRVMHRDDVRAGTRDVEQTVTGREPVRLADDLLVVPVPGHTRGSAALLAGEEVLFSGDHLWWSETSRRLHASRGVCWWSWPEQTRSMERLLDLRFEWLLPGHGRRWRAPSAQAMRVELEHLVQRMRAAA
jgi:glyoxylase-like metal-dependent hydrolase (beta-lactamase superfamily II)/ferredoxin